MTKSPRIFAASFALLSLVAAGAYSQQASAQPPPAVDPEAVKLLRGMTDYIGSLKQFSLTVLNMREDVLESGHRVDFEATTKINVSRPNKLQGERKGHLTDQIFYYDGKKLTLYNPSEKVYASTPAAPTIEETLDFAHESLGLSYPISDLVRPNVFPLLIQDVTLALNIGKEVVGGIKCDHLLFSRPGVDFQVWIADSGKPLPHKYVVTDRGTTELLSVTTLMSDWNVAPTLPSTQFDFIVPAGAKEITFLPLRTSSGRTADASRREK